MCRLCKGSSARLQSWRCSWLWWWLGRLGLTRCRWGRVRDRRLRGLRLLVVSCFRFWERRVSILDSRRASRTGDIKSGIKRESGASSKTGDTEVVDRGTDSSGLSTTPNGKEFKYLVALRLVSPTPKPTPRPTAMRITRTTNPRQIARLQPPR